MRSQSSHDAWRGSDRQPAIQGSTQRRHRSESRCSSGRRISKKAVFHKSDHCYGIRHACDIIRVFSRTANQWVDAEFAELLEDNVVHVEYKVGDNLFGKTMHVHSHHIAILAEHDPGVCPALMQGCRDGLPLSPEKYYLSMEYILEILRSGDVVLLKGSWLLKCFHDGAVLPRRQELPAEAIWDVNELEVSLQTRWSRLVGMGMEFAHLPCVECISISHCWYTQEHPDPKGDQLQDIGPFIAARLRRPDRRDPWNEFETGRNDDLAVFWCWCSFFQEPRSPTEQAAFERSMEHMDLWYANKHFEVWMLSKVPRGVRGYHDRGWTTWERTVSSIVSGVRVRQLDLGSYTSSLIGQTWDEVASTFSREIRTPPIHPDMFDEIITKKHFTKGYADLERVKSNYRRNFCEIMSAVLSLHYRCTEQWGLSEMTQLCRVLPCCFRLAVLQFWKWNFKDEGMEVLADAIQHCCSLEHMTFIECGIGDAGIVSLTKIVDSFPRLQSLRIGPFEHLSQAVRQGLVAECDGRCITVFGYFQVDCEKFVDGGRVFEGCDNPARRELFLSSNPCHPST